jgi:hypothetical protein
LAGLDNSNYSETLAIKQVVTILGVKKSKSLFSEFKPESYELSVNPSDAVAHLEIIGSKTGRPSHRITLHQRKLKIIKAEIIPKNRKTSAVEVDRINHLPTFEQVRLHTKQAIYPGVYQIIIEYQSPKDRRAGLPENGVPNRELLPSIDEPAAWEAAQFELKS